MIKIICKHCRNVQYVTEALLGICKAFYCRVCTNPLNDSVTEQVKLHHRDNSGSSGSLPSSESEK